MGRYKNAGIGVGIGTSPQTALENNEYENKVHALEGKLSKLKAKQETKKSKTEDTKSLNESNFPFEESKNKIDNYLLNTENEQGQSKARFFIEVLGYSKSNGKQLFDNLVNAIKDKVPTRIENTKFGEVREFHEKIKAINGKYEYANIVIVVQKDNGKTTYRFITAYPDKKEKC